MVIKGNESGKKIEARKIEAKKTDAGNEDPEFEKPIFFPLLFLVFLVVVNFLSSLLIFCNALILYQNNFILIMAIYSFLV